MNEKVPFGFQDVEPGQKTAEVRALFSRVASRYDLMNDVMSLGVHRAWKNHFMSCIHPEEGHHLLDVAGGTGDISFRFLDACHKTQATVCDMNIDMLRAGQERPGAKKYLTRINWVCGDASHLPFDDNHFDTYTISFGLRNVTDIPAALSEAYRVLKPGGRYFCLEFSKPTSPLLQKLYHQYSFYLIPKWGQLLAQDRAAYQYLVESIERFPQQGVLNDMIQQAGFSYAQFQNLSGGIAAIHKGVKI